jgi:hypothetical protein
MSYTASFANGEEIPSASRRPEGAGAPEDGRPDRRLVAASLAHQQDNSTTHQIPQNAYAALP